LVYRDGSQWTVTDFLTVCNFILSVVEVPDIKETVDTGQVKETASLWGPAAIRQIGGVVSGLHYWCWQVLVPDLSRPITYGEEVLGVTGVTPQRINWTKMLSIFVAKSSCNIEGFSLVCLQYVTLLGSDKIVERTGLSQVF